MKVLTSHKATDINYLPKNNIEKESLIITVNSTSCEDFSRMFDTHNSLNPIKPPPKQYRGFHFENIEN
jgi:hypothetical protein